MQSSQSETFELETLYHNKIKETITGRNVYLPTAPKFPRVGPSRCQPPLTGRLVPMIMRASSEARNRMALAISTVSTARLAGCCTAPLVAISCGQKIKSEKRHTDKDPLVLRNPQEQHLEAPSNYDDSLARPPSKFLVPPSAIKTVARPPSNYEVLPGHHRNMRQSCRPPSNHETVPIRIFRALLMVEVTPQGKPSGIGCVNCEKHAYMWHDIFTSVWYCSPSNVSGGLHGGGPPMAIFGG